jgi:hypothetical protein
VQSTKEHFPLASRGAIRSSSIQETVRGGVGPLGRRLTKEMPCQGEAAHFTRSSTHHDPARTMGRVRGQTLRSPDRIGGSGARRAGVELIAGGGDRAPSTGLPAGRCRLLQWGARQPRRPGLSALQLMLMCVSMAILLHSYLRPPCFRRISLLIVDCSRESASDRDLLRRGCCIPGTVLSLSCYSTAGLSPARIEMGKTPL